MIQYHPRIDDEFAPGYGAAGVPLGASVASLREAYMLNWSFGGGVGCSFDQGNWSATLNPLELQWLQLAWKNVAIFHINVILGMVGGVEVRAGYVGALWSTIFVGDAYPKFQQAAEARGWISDLEIENGWEYFSSRENPGAVLGVRIAPGGDLDHLEPSSSDDVIEALQDAPILAIHTWRSDMVAPLCDFDIPKSWQLAQLRGDTPA